MDTRKFASNRFAHSGSRRSILALLLSLAVAAVGGSAAFARSQPPEMIYRALVINSESQLRSRLDKRLATIPYYNVFDSLGYRLEGTRVTLYGQVLFPLSRSEVEAYVKQVPGVTRVVNRIQELSPSPFDNQIRRAEFRALYSSDSPLFRYSLGVTPAIHIVVDRGNVRLVGEVGSDADRQIAGLRARTVPGVFSVRNDVTVRNEAAAR